MIQFERLEKLANHLLYGKLLHKHFNIYFYNTTRNHVDEDYDENGCGTVGCAIGECPAVFPNEWEFREINPLLIESRSLGSRYFSTKEDGMIFFGINFHDYDYLFMPMAYYDNPSKEDVARRILEFIKNNKSIE